MSDSNHLIVQMSDKSVEENRIRSFGAESVELTAEKWQSVLEEIQVLRKLAFDLQALFECKDGLLSATGECNQRVCSLLVDTAKIVHAVKYAEVE